MRILVAEDDAETARTVSEALSDEGHEATIASDGGTALRLLLAGAFDVAVLDRMLPGRDGLAVMREARASGIQTVFLVVTALGSIANRVEGLDSGADDYLTKPFALSELVARVNALGRRLLRDAEATRIVRGPLALDVLRREARVRGRRVALQPRELRLLEELMRGDGQTLTRAMLLKSVWDLGFEPQTNIVETHMSRLRSKLAFAGLAEVIRTVRGSGYALKLDERC